MNKKAVPTAAAVRELAILTGAVAIIAAAVYFFLVPSHASVSSISGLGIVLANFVPLPLSAITMILNVVLLVIGFLTCGREFGAKTVYTSILLPAFIGLFERLFPNLGSLTDSQELDVLCYILVVSVGLSILFNRNASSGGLDIVAKIMNKYLHMDLGKAMSLSGMCVALSAALVYDKKTVVLSVLGTYFNGLVLDHFIFDNNIKRRVCIITGKEEELRRFIIEDLHSGATVYESYGAYNMQKRREIITIVDKAEYQKLMSYMNREDPQAFITVYTVSDMRYQPKGNTAQFPPYGLSTAPADLRAKSRRKRRLRSEAPRCGSVCGTASALPKCSIMSGCGTRIVLRGKSPSHSATAAPASVRCIRHWRRSPLQHKVLSALLA